MNMTLIETTSATALGSPIAADTAVYTASTIHTCTVGTSWLTRMAAVAKKRVYLTISGTTVTGAPIGLGSGSTTNVQVIAALDSVDPRQDSVHTSPATNDVFASDPHPWTF